MEPKNDSNQEPTDGHTPRGVREFRYAVHGSVYDGIRGVYVWTLHELRIYPFPGQLHDWAARMEEIHTTGIEEFIQYAWDTQLGGYSTFSRPGTVAAKTFTGAAEAVASDLGTALEWSVVNHWKRSDVPPWDNEVYKRYRYVLSVASEVLLRGNLTPPGVYVDLRPAKDWGHRMMTLFVKPYSKDVESQLYIEDFEDVLLIQDSACDPSNIESWLKSNLGALGRESHESDVQQLARLAGLGLAPAVPDLPPVSDSPETRFEIWGRMLAAAVPVLDLLEELIPAEAPWSMSNSFHSGWGTYYVHYHSWDNRWRLSISEAGHFAAPDEALFDDDGSFNLRRTVMQEPPELTSEYLLGRVRAMHRTRP